MVGHGFSSRCFSRASSDRAPQSPVGGEPRVDLGERLGPEPVEPALGVGAHVDEAGLAQDPEVLRHGGLAQAEPVNQFADRALAVAQQVENRATGGFGEDGEAHDPNMPPSYMPVKA